VALLRKLYDGLVITLAALAGLAVATMAISVTYDVIVRAVGFRPPAFTSALVEYLLLYFCLFAAPYLTRQKVHVSIDAMVSRLPDRPRKHIERLAYLICVLTCLLFAYISSRLLIDAWNTGLFDERAIDIPMWLLYAPMPISFLLVATEFARYLFGFDRFYVDRTVAQDSV
jgi:C4-dicarboxylate transporter, DctQ subunit